MQTFVTVVQVLLTIFFFAGGTLKLVRPYAKFKTMPYQEWAQDFAPWQVRLIGVLEVAGGLGIGAALFWPAWRPLTPLAAAGGALIMAGAMATHLRCAEYVNMAGNSVWLGLTLFMTYSKLMLMAG